MTNFSIKHRIVKYRKELGLSQEEMAQKLAVPHRSYQRWEQEEPKRFDKNMLSSYANIGVNLHWLLTGEGPEPEKSSPNLEDLDRLFDAAREKAASDPDFAGWLKVELKKVIE